MNTSTLRNASESLAISVAEVARLLNISTRHVWKMTSTGRLPQPIRFGRSVRWLRADIQQKLDEIRAEASR